MFPMLCTGKWPILMSPMTNRIPCAECLQGNDAGPQADARNGVKSIPRCEIGMSVPPAMMVSLSFNVGNGAQRIAAHTHFNVREKDCSIIGCAIDLTLGDMLTEHVTVAEDGPVIRTPVADCFQNHCDRSDVKAPRAVVTETA